MLSIAYAAACKAELNVPGLPLSQVCLSVMNASRHPESALLLSSSDPAIGCRYPSNKDTMCRLVDLLHAD